MEDIMDIPRRSALALTALLFASVSWSQGLAFVPKAEAESGAIKLLLHTYRVGPAATSSTFDFVNQGGQEILFPFNRLTALLDIGERHELRFTYQPLEIVTTVNFRSAVTVDGKTFNGPTRMTYGFPFYRTTYLYRFLGDPGESWLSAGAAIQLRNASIRFESLDGSTLANSQNLGVVPALALAGRLDLGGGLFAAFDATGIYASSAFINGANFQFEGSILDASARLGYQAGRSVEVFMNGRFFGGSAAGVSGYERSAWGNSESGETANYIASAALTLGATVRLPE
jgi:hypothetical protein